MQKVVECVPNFSEGRDLKIINQIFNAAKNYKSKNGGLKVFELEYNSSHNRCLFTIVGEPLDVLNSVYESIKVATKLIDMNKHIGEHPRIGSTDVVPFVPVSYVTMEECIKLSKELGSRIGKELKVPVFLYEASATKKENINLADIRVGEYEGLKNKMNNPDYGPNKTHPTAGAIVIGARKYLVAFNVNLDTSDVDIAKEIAKKIREKDGGLKKVKALGFEVDGLAQVSINLVDFKVTNFDEVYKEIEKFANEKEIKIKSSEIYGMIPLESLVKAIKTTFKIDNFKQDQILEKRLWE